MIWKANASMKVDCCARKNCILDQVLLKQAIDTVVMCYKEIELLSRKEKKDYLRDKINQSCIMNLQPITGRKNLKYDWCIGCNTSRVKNVCKERFMLCYDMKHCYLEQLCADVKKGLNSSAIPLSDKSNFSIRKNSDTGKYIQDIINKTKQQGLNLTREQISMMKLPNSVDAIIAYGWMEFYFNLLGDTESNIDEVHLDPITIESIFSEYCFDMGSDEKSMPNCGIKPLSNTVFVELWKNAFLMLKFANSRMYQESVKLVHVCHIYDVNIEERSNVS